MANVDLEHPVQALHGKVSSKDHTFYRHVFGITRLNRLSKRQSATKYTENQLRVQSLFKAAQEAARNALMEAATRPTLEAEFKAQSKYKTLWGYVFAKFYHSL